MNLLIATLPILILSACVPLVPSVSRSLAEAKVVDGPVIIQRGENYFLHLRRQIDSKDGSTLHLPVAFKRSGADGLYYFYGPVSGSYYGQILEQPLVYNKGATELAKAGRLYWLNPDNSTHRIPLRKETN